MKNMYDTLIETCTNERLDEVVFLDPDFCKINKELGKALKRFDKLSLPRKKVKKIDRIFTLYGEQSARYTVLAYAQGIKDAVYLLKQMGVI